VFTEQFIIAVAIGGSLFNEVHQEIAGDFAAFQFATGITKFLKNFFSPPKPHFLIQSQRATQCGQS
jgi:hypothetical protein